MSPPRDGAPPAASLAAKRKSLAEWKQLMLRYPLNSPWALVSPLLAALVANAMTAQLLISGRMTPFELVVLVALEALLLMGMAWLQTVGLPREALENNPMPMRQRLGVLGFGLFWLCGVYSIVFFAMVPSGEEILRAARDPVGFLSGSNLKWPLLVTALGAMFDSMRDAAHLRRHGGTLVSTPGLHGIARWLTLILGGIPFFVPFAALVFGLVHLGKSAYAFLIRRYGAPGGRMQILLMLMIPLAAWLVLNGVAWVGAWLEPLIKGVGWWALCYVSAKFVAELFFISIPLIAVKAHAEETQALAQPASAQVSERD